MKKTFNQTMPCAVHLAALLLVPAVCVAFSGCSAVPGSSGSSAAEPSPSPAAAEPAAKPDLPSLRPLYQGDENGYYTFMTAASGDYQQVLYADYQTGTQAPACHITGCTHDSPSCPACFFTGVPVTLPYPVGDGTYLSFVYGYDSDGMSIVRLNQDYGVEQVLYHCNYISSFYCYTDGSSLWFSTCPSGDSYDRIKRLDLSTGGITTLFDAGDTSGQSANIIGCTGRQLVVSVSPYYDSSEPQTSCLYLVDADTGAAELLHSQFTTLQDSAALPHYDLAFITNPTSLHAQALEEIRGLADALFIEKPIVSAEQTDVDLATLLPAGQKAYVAAPMRWCGTMLALKNHLPGLRPYSARVICSSYLPDWRPGVDYRTVYSAHKALGGGVTIDLIHEWDYLVDLFGVPETICNIRGKYSDLEIDSDDLSIYIAQYPTLLAEVHLDYFGRTYRRSIELFCKDGSCVADFGAGTLTLPNGAVEHYEEDVNERYLREMNYFLDYAAGEETESLNPPATALQVLKLTLGEQQ